MISRKKILKRIIISILCSPILLYIGVVIANNCIADSVEKELKSIPLPPNTEYVDSISIAGKIFGNGNGMQYYGAVLITSELTEEELREYYREYDEDYDGQDYDNLFSVNKQETDVVIEYGRWRFKKFDNSKNNYVISVLRINPHSYTEEEDFIAELLDLDIRAHWYEKNNYSLCCYFGLYIRAYHNR